MHTHHYGSNPDKRHPVGAVVPVTPLPEQKRPPWREGTRFWAAVGIMIGVLAVVITKNIGVLLGVVWLFAVVVAWDVIAYYIHRKGWRFGFTSLAAVVTGVLLFFVWMYSTRKPKSTLIVSSYTSNIDLSAGGTVFGIQWKKGWQDQRLRISATEDQIHDLDLTVQEIGGGFDEIKQISTIAGVEISPSDIPDTHFGINGDDGSVSTLSSRDLFDMAGVTQPLYGTKFHLFCPRLHKGIELRLVMAVSPLSKSKSPAILRILGTYEKATNDGIDLVSVDSTIEVKQPQ